MWAYYSSVDDYSAAIRKTYTPGSPVQAQKNMYNYAIATAKDMPMLWMPGGYGMNETARYIHGVESAYDPVEAFTLWNWVTIAH